MMNLKRDWSLYFILSLTLLTIALYLLRIQSFSLIDHIYFQNYDGRHFIYWLLYYPSELFAGVFPVGLVIFLAQLWRLRSQKIKDVTQYALGFVFVATLLSLGWLFLLFNMTDGLYPNHINTVQFRDATYHFGDVAYIGGSTYVLAKCDSLGLMCEAAYVAIKHEYPSSSYFGEIRLIIYPYGLELQIDNETVYTAPRFSR